VFDKTGINLMAKIYSQRIIVLLCPTCELPMPLEDYDESGIYFGKCAICELEYRALRKAGERDKYEIRPKAVN